MKSRIIIFLIVFNLFSLNIISQVPLSTPSQKKIALVMGNGNYISNVLANPENDADSIESVLKKLGFIVYKYENLNQGQMKRAIDDFGLKLKNYNVSLFYYAGHGIQLNGYNYLIPVDAQLQTERDIEYECVQADRILAKMEGSGTKVNIIILDACRNNPFERSWTRSSTGRGLAFMNAPGGTLIAYSTAPGSTAADGSGKNSPYTSAVLESIEIPDFTITQVFQNVARILKEKTNQKQVPWYLSSLTGDFYFKRVDYNQANIQSETKVTVAESKVKNNITSAASRPLVSPNSKPETTNKGGIDSANMPEIELFIDSRDNQQYKMVKIGNQVWMAENLKTTKLNDSTTIPLITDKAYWSLALGMAYCYYENSEPVHVATYGILYNWFTVKSGKLCPKGWHVPTDSEWSALVDYIGGPEIGGGKLKEVGDSHWRSPNANATNNYNFGALPGGARFRNGTFDFIGSLGGWWSSTEQSPDYAFYRGVYFNYGVINKDYENKSAGFSVRCIKD
jgi:uncharacterized protein (TIGR02145 family)